MLEVWDGQLFLEVGGSELKLLRRGLDIFEEVGGAGAELGGN